MFEIRFIRPQMHPKIVSPSTNSTCRHVRNRYSIRCHPPHPPSLWKALHRHCFLLATLLYPTNSPYSRRPLHPPLFPHHPLLNHYYRYMCQPVVDARQNLSRVPKGTSCIWRQISKVHDWFRRKTVNCCRQRVVLSSPLCNQACRQSSMKVMVTTLLLQALLVMPKRKCLHLMSPNVSLVIDFFIFYFV